MTDGSRQWQQVLQAVRQEIQHRQRSGFVSETKVESQVLDLQNNSEVSDMTSIHEFNDLQSIRQDLGDCTRCKLHATRKNIVFGVGNANADLVIVGEAPGRDEDVQGEPFVGRAGKLLTSIVEAIGLSRQDIYICNVIKCRPPQNRNPENDEIASCSPYLLAQIKAIAPAVICTVGKFAAQTVLQTDTPISKLRGHFHQYHGIDLMPTYHPAYLLRNPSAKKDVWQDMQQVHAKLCEKTGKALKLKTSQSST